MKTSPFKTQGGVSPLKQDPRLMVTASNGVRVPKANLKDYENSLREANKDIAKENVKKFISEPVVNENLLNVIPGSGEIVDAKNAIKDLINKDYGGAALNTAGFFLPFLPGGVLKAKGKDIINYLKKIPGVDNLLKSGKKLTKQQKMDFEKGFAEELQAKGGVTPNWRTADTQKMPTYGPTSTKELAKQKASYIADMIPRHNKAIDEFDRYRRGIKTKFKNKASEVIEKAGGTVRPRYFESQQNMMDQFPLEERLKYLSETNIKDDWLFSGGVTKKGGKYFDVDGIEIPLDPKVSYTPPNLRKNFK